MARLRFSRLSRLVGSFVLPLLSVVLSACSGGGGNKAEFALGIPATLPDPRPAPMKAAFAKASPNLLNALDIKPYQAPDQLFIFHVFVSVHVPGARPIQWRWDSPCGFDIEDPARLVNCPNPPPATAELQVPAGPGRIAQVFVVGVNPARGDGPVFLYGDQTMTLSSGANPPATVPLAIMGSSGEGRIAGRFLDRSGQGITGEVQVFVHPPGKPPLELTLLREAIFGGWFSFVSFKNMPFSYHLMRPSGGMRIFESVTPESFTSADSRILRVSIPKTRMQWGDTRGATEFVFGTFAAEPSGLPASRPVCYVAEQGVIPGIADGTGSNDEDGIEWAADGTRGTGDGDPNDDVYVMNGGARNTSTGACAATTSNFVDKLVFNHRGVASWDGEGAFGFSGPFRVKRFGFGPAGAEWDLDENGNIRLKWEYVPGATSGPEAIQGLELFVKVGAGGLDNGGNKDVPCSDLIGKFGYVSRGVRLTSEASEISFAVSPAQMKEAKAVLCPYRDTSAGREYLSAGKVVFDRFAPWDLPAKPDLMLAKNDQEVDWERLGFFGNERRSFLRAMLSNSSGAHAHFVPAVRRYGNQPDLIQASDVELFEVNDGTGYSTLTLNETNDPAPQHLNIPAHRLVTTANADGTLRIRYRLKVEAAQRTRVPLDEEGRTFESGIISLIGTTACANPGLPTVQYRLRDGNWSGTMNNITSAFSQSGLFGASGTDLLVPLRLRYFNESQRSCELAEIPIWKMEYLDSSTPQNNCFGLQDIEYSGRLGEIVISPKDRTGSDCDVTDAVLKLHTMAPNGGSTLFESTFAAGSIIRHSTVRAGLRPYLAASNAWVNPSSLVLDRLISGTEVEVRLQSVAVNSDNKPTVLNPLESADWSQVAANFWSAAPSTTPATSFNAITAASVPATANAQVNVLRQNGRAMGSYTSLLTSVNGRVLAVSQQRLLGGSPIFIVQNSPTERRAYFVPSNGSGEIVGQPLMALTTPPALSPGGRAFAFVSDHIDGGNYYVLASGPSLQLNYYHHEKGNSTPLALQYTNEPNWTISGLEVIRSWDSTTQQPVHHLILLIENTSNSNYRILRWKLPTLVSGSWPAPANLPVASNVLPGTGIGTLNAQKLLGLKVCRGDGLRIGVGIANSPTGGTRGISGWVLSPEHSNNGDLSIPAPVSLPLRTTSVPNLDLLPYNGLDCFYQNATGSMPPRLELLAHSTSVFPGAPFLSAAPPVVVGYAWNSGITPQTWISCGAANIPNAINNSDPMTVSQPIRGVTSFGMWAGETGFIMAADGGADLPLRTQLREYRIVRTGPISACSPTTGLSLSAPKILGSVVSKTGTADSEQIITGASMAEDYDGRRLTIFGTKGQVYEALFH